MASLTVKHCQRVENEIILKHLNKMKLKLEERVKVEEKEKEGGS